MSRRYRNYRDCSTSCSSGDSSDDSSSTDSDDSCGGCCARPISALSQTGKFETCDRFAKKFMKNTDANPKMKAGVTWNADTYLQILLIGGEDVQLTKRDLQAIAKKQLCVTIITPNDVCVRQKLRNKKDVEEMIDATNETGTISVMIANRRAYDTYRFLKRQYEKTNRKDVFGDPVNAVGGGPVNAVGGVKVEGDVDIF